MVQYFPVVTGSLTVTGSVNISGAITASGGISISGSIASASYADTASFVTLAQTASFVTTAQTASFVTTAQTASFVANAQSASNAVTAQTASFANTFTVASTLTAQTLVVQTITSSVDFVTGSTRFGSLLTNTHVFSGSVTMNPNGLFVSGSGLVGIGTTAPNSKLDIRSSGLDTDVLSIYGTTGGAKMFDFRDDSASGVTAAMFRMYNSSGTETIRLFPGTVSVHHSWMLLSGNLGIGTTSPSSKLHIFSSTSGVSHRIESTATNGEPSVNFYGKNSSGTVRSFAIKYDNADIVRFGTSDAISMRFETSDIERIRITSGGDVFINNSSGVSLNGLTNKLSISSTTYNLFDISRFSDNAFGPNFYLVKSRNGSIGGNTIVASGDNLGNITWVGATGGTGLADAANIRAEVDGTPGTGDMPGRLVFSTTADGSSSTTERMRINSSGNILMSTTTAPSVPSGNIMVFNNTIFFDYTSGVGSPYTSNLRVDIVWNNWGSNHVAALIDVDFLAREFGNLGGVSFGRIYALSSGGATTFNNTINTANVTTANGTLAVSSPANFMLRLLFTPTNIKDYIGCFIRIPVNSAGTGAAVASITATLV